jgi:hypothetical protein
MAHALLALLFVVSAASSATEAEFPADEPGYSIE